MNSVNYWTESKVNSRLCAVALDGSVFFESNRVMCRCLRISSVYAAAGVLPELVLTLSICVHRILCSLLVISMTYLSD